MSGREHEPAGAFLPSIDKNLMRDLDRHLRNAASPSEATAQQPDIVASTVPPANGFAETESGQTAPHPGAGHRLSTSGILEAVGQAAASMAAMSARIQELEAKQFELSATNNQLRTKLSEVLQSQQGADARLKAEAERASRAEDIAARHLSRCQILEGDLSAALGDLNRIAEAINGSLGGSGPVRRRM